jgi:hypothetical protein
MQQDDYENLHLKIQHRAHPLLNMPEHGARFDDGVWMIQRRTWRRSDADQECAGLEPESELN